ncbi:MAG: hypothetical protein KAV70_02405 [Bacteroidales bacterium]|nr:hypothetical protein [Bacteroidales bacterium]
MKKLILTILISSFIITASPAQKHGSSGISKIKNWSVAMYLGWKIGGPCKQIEDAMVTNGFDDHKGGGWFGGSGTDHPYTDNFMPSWMISVKYYLKSPFSIGIVGGKTNLGSTHGYKIENWGNNLYIDYSVFNISPIFSYNSYDIVRIGIGPSVYFTKAWESRNHPEGVDVEYRHTKVGFLIDFGLRIPKKSRFFFELNAQYRYVGKAEIGPFNENPYRDMLPKTEVKYNHVFISGGFGVRF